MEISASAGRRSVNLLRIFMQASEFCRQPFRTFLINFILCPLLAIQTYKLPSKTSSAADGHHTEVLHYQGNTGQSKWSAKYNISPGSRKQGTEPLKCLQKQNKIASLSEPNSTQPNRGHLNLCYHNRVIHVLHGLRTLQDLVKNLRKEKLSTRSPLGQISPPDLFINKAPYCIVEHTFQYCSLNMVNKWYRFFRAPRVGGSFWAMRWDRAMW